MLRNKFMRLALVIISSGCLSAVYADCPSQTLIKGESLNTLATTGKLTLSGNTYSMLTADQTNNNYNKKLLPSPKALEGFLKLTKQAKSIFEPRILSLTVPNKAYCAYNISVIMPGNSGGENFVIALRNIAEKENLPNATPKP